MIERKSGLQLYLFLFVLTAIFSAGCNFVKTADKTPTLLKTEEATHAELMADVNRFARVNSMRAYLAFGDRQFLLACDNVCVHDAGLCD